MGQGARACLVGIRPGPARCHLAPVLLVALANAAPVAVTSSLFLFFVESRLGAPGWEGPLLLLFFVAAAGAAPLWGMLAERMGAKRTLMAAMVLSILSFSFALLLGTGDIGAFAADLPCIGRGTWRGPDAAAGDLCPADGNDRTQCHRRLCALVVRVEIHAGFCRCGATSNAGRGRVFFGRANSEIALLTLSLLYALVPCILKACRRCHCWPCTKLEEE